MKKIIAVMLMTFSFIGCDGYETVNPEIQQADTYKLEVEDLNDNDMVFMKFDLLPTVYDKYYYEIGTGTKYTEVFITLTGTGLFEIIVSTGEEIRCWAFFMQGYPETLEIRYEDNIKIQLTEL